jgi:hypothetical protein
MLQKGSLIGRRLAPVGDQWRRRPFPATSPNIHENWDPPRGFSASAGRADFLCRIASALYSRVRIGVVVLSLDASPVISGRIRDVWAGASAHVEAGVPTGSGSKPPCRVGLVTIP